MNKQTIKSRVEYDSLGEVNIPAGQYYGAQTQRSIENFPISWEQMPLEIMHALAIIKQAAAFANNKLGLLSSEKSEVISYETATKIVKKAVAENLTLKESAIKLAVLSEQEFVQLIDVKSMANLE